MKIDQTIFRRYDIRGRFPKEFSEREAYAIALSFANLHPKMKTVVVGGDARKSTPKIKKAVIEGLADGGKSVIDSGIVITPVVYFGVCHFSHDAGIMITGSHLGGEYNGIKFVLEDAKPTTPEDYEKIMQCVVNDEFEKAKEKGDVEEKNLESEYIHKR